METRNTISTQLAESHFADATDPGRCWSLHTHIIPHILNHFSSGHVMVRTIRDSAWI